MDCFVVFASLKLPRNDEISGRFCEIRADSALDSAKLAILFYFAIIRTFKS
ncbi:hypothetical protein [Helicobacter sp. 23-1045]